MDRICALRPTNIRFDARRHGSIDKLVDEMVAPTDLKPATLRFNREAAAEVRQNRYYWGFVREVIHPEGVEMHFLTPDYDYMVRWLAGFCDRVVVLAPADLKQRMRVFAQRLQLHYLE